MKRFKDFLNENKQSINIENIQYFIDEFKDVELTEIDIEDIKMSFKYGDINDLDEQFYEDIEEDISGMIKSVEEYQTLMINEHFTPNYIIYEDGESQSFVNILEELKIEPIETFNVTGLEDESEDEISIYEFENGHIAIVEISGYQSSMIIAYCDDDFLNTNLMKSIKSIGKFNL